MALSVMAYLLTVIFGLLCMKELFSPQKKWSRFFLWLFFLIGSVVSSIYDIVQRREDDDNKVKEIISKGKNSVDSARIVIIDSVNDSRDKIIANNDSIIREIMKLKNPNNNIKQPLLILTFRGNNPSFTKENGRIKLRVDVSNYGDAAAANLVDKLVGVTYDGEKPYFGYFQHGSLANKQSDIFPVSSTAMNFYYFMMPPNGKTFDMLSPIFIYFKLNYTDLANRHMKPIRSAFCLDNNGIRKTFSDEYNKLEKELIKEGAY